MPPLNQNELRIGDTLWIEFKGKRKLVGPVVLVGSRFFGFVPCYVFEQHDKFRKEVPSVAMVKDDCVISSCGYGYTWRCWSYEPRMERREQAGWKEFVR